MAIKLIIFDLSNVCFNEEEGPYLKKFAEENNLNFREFEARYTKLLHKAENNEMAGKKLWEVLLSHYGITADADAEKIMDVMISGKVAYMDTLALVKKLKKKYKTAFFTNYNKDYWKRIAEKFDLNEYFDYGLVSYMIGARKPARKGFLHILDRFNIQPENAVFIDDTSRNLEMADEIGIKTIQFNNLNQLKDSLHTLGVSIE